jgi:hypothetical protein
MIRDIPRHTTEQELYAFFDRAFPGQVAHVQRGYRTPGLWKVREELRVRVLCA